MEITNDVEIRGTIVNTARLAMQLNKSGLALPEKIAKRDGSTVTFDISRIEKAIESCWSELQHKGNIPASSVRQIVDSAAVAIASRHQTARLSGSPYPSVEQIQDLVEVTLLTHSEVDAARAYMAYRDSHAKARSKTLREAVPAHVREAFEVDAGHFDTPMQRFAFYDKYSRYNESLGRRETWPETVDRTVEHLKWEVRYHFATHPDFGNMDLESSIPVLNESEMESLWPDSLLPEEMWDRLKASILNMDVMPSMRLLAMAGKAVRRNSLSQYNCSFLPIDSIDAFVEILTLSMSGCGVGYSVERANVEKFPRVRRAQKGVTLPVHVVADSAEGWADALSAGLSAWWSGLDLDFDYSAVRPAGSVLRTKGGRSSGPAALRKSLGSIRDIVLSRQGSFIGTLDAHDIACWVGECAVQGGTRRTALIALFDIGDDAMRTCKSGMWGTWPRERENANNSAVWLGDISDLDIMKQMMEMLYAGSGEPGIFSRHAAASTMTVLRKSINDDDVQWGVNPCGEILLRPMGLCNLSQAIARPGDTESDLANKVELATIIGTIQSLSTRFPHLRGAWKTNCEEERLLGVDLTAQNDCEILRPDNSEGDVLRQRLRDYAISVNETYSQLLHVAQSASVTCNKPAGNSTGFIGASGSGIHKAFAPYYVRRMTVGAHTPQFRVLREAGVPMKPYAGQEAATADRWWAEFPMKAPAGSPLLRDTSAVEQCEFWLLNKKNWTTHNPSCTVSYRVHEMVNLVKWVCEHKEIIGGLSFLPVDDTVYPIMPFTEISEDEYALRVSNFPDVDYSLLWLYERSDMTEASQTLACSSAMGCEL